MIFTRTNALKGEITVPGDKSISHRSIMFGALAEGTTRVTNFLRGADCLSTIDCFRKLGIDIKDLDSEILIHGKGLHGLTAPSSMLDVGNSGTTTRLISGILAGQRFTTELNGDESIQIRPMKRIMEPLTLMGADITSIRDHYGQGRTVDRWQIFSAGGGSVKRNRYPSVPYGGTGGANCGRICKNGALCWWLCRL